ncbi:MAG: hypothetical protein LCI00_19300 [Chloroflexi bacterium]|nr:hypothetical protein [Chloroflexota bacterium]MCC6891452.1 hypothetical protein [Anaerolineae bacterium]
MSKLITTSLVTANIEALDQALKTALTEAICFGVAADKNGYAIVLDDKATAAQVNQALAIAAAHDPNVLTAKQQAEVTRAAKLEQMRRDYTAVDFDLSAYGSQPALIQKMAQKIAWMEQEINQLRSRISG